MLKIFIRIRKKLWLQPKWRILRVYTKTIPRHKIKNLKEVLVKQINKDGISNEQRAYLRGKLEIVNLLLVDEKHKRV